MITLTCECCGFTQEFRDGEEAFAAGWDAPPHFTQVVACNLCPASYIVLGQVARHASVHERWDREGRPTEFSQETCVVPEDRVDPNELEKIRKILGGN